MRQKHIPRKGAAQPWRTSATASGHSGFHLFFMWSLWPRSRRAVRRAGLQPTYVATERSSLAPHVERAVREREEERLFGEQFRARLRPVSVDRPPTSPKATPFPVIRTSSAIAAPVSPPTGVGATGQAASTSPHSSFTAAVMARISTPALPSDAPPEAPPAMSLAFGAASGGRAISYAMVAQHVRALFGMYGLAALIVLLSGALFSFFAPTLVFTGLSLLVSGLVVAITTVGQVWRTLDGMVGGLGVLYLALTLFVAPFLLLAFQARAGSAYSKA